MSATGQKSDMCGAVVLLRYSEHGPLLETTRGLDGVVIGAIAVARERP